MKRYICKGFTIIEIIAVISIIIILAGLLLPTLKQAREQAMTQQARAMISALEVAVNMYHTDTGMYPSGATWVTLLVSGNGGYGPYMDSRDVTANQFQDPWNQAYHYRTTAINNITRSELWSDGPNKIDESGAGDDITNW